MARRSLRPELNRIRAWVRQGRTDAWIAHQLEVTVQQIQAFKREQGLEPNGDPDAGAAADFDDEIDLRAEDDALIAAELEAAEAQRAEEADEAEEDDEDEGDGDKAPAKRRRGRRGGRRTTRRKGKPIEATFDTARRATAFGSTPPSRTIRSTPSTGPDTVRSRSRSKRIRSSSGASATTTAMTTTATASSAVYWLYGS